MFYFKSKTITHKQAAMIGFVLAVLSLLSTAVLLFVFPLLGAWLNKHGIYQLDLFLIAFIFTIFVAIQGILLFGFPLYYAQDKKSHMTGFQILLYELLWMIVMVVAVASFLVPIKVQHSSYTLEEMVPAEMEVTQ